MHSRCRLDSSRSAASVSSQGTPVSLKMLRKITALLQSLLASQNAGRRAPGAGRKHGGAAGLRPHLAALSGSPPARLPVRLHPDRRPGGGAAPGQALDPPVRCRLDSRTSCVDSRSRLGSEGKFSCDLNRRSELLILGVSHACVCCAGCYELWHERSAVGFRPCSGGECLCMCCCRCAQIHIQPGALRAVRRGHPHVGHGRAHVLRLPHLPAAAARRRAGRRARQGPGRGVADQGAP